MEAEKRDMLPLIQADDLLCAVSRLEVLKCCETVSHVLFDTCEDVGSLCLLELLAYDVLVKLDVTLCDAVHDFLGHLRNLLSVLALEAVGHEPLAYELL